MRILYISHLHPPEGKPLESIGGVQTMSKQLLEHLKKRDDVEVLPVLHKSSYNGIILSTTFFLYRLLFKIPRLVKKFKPDVILMSSMVTAGAIPCIPRFRLKKVPVVTINHGHDVTLTFPIYQWYVPKIFNRLAGVISVSSATRQECIKRGMEPEKGVSLSNGFDMKASKEIPKKDQARKYLKEHTGIELANRKVLLTVGRQIKRKGHAWFIEEVIPKITDDFVFLAIGEGSETELLRDLRNQSAKKEQIFIMGKQPDAVLENAYAAADIFVMPNIPVSGDLEGFGIVLLEANRVGLPAVAADLEGIRDVIEQGVNGFRVPHSNAVLFAGKINELLKSDLQELSASAKKYVNETFSWDVVADNYLRYLKSVTKNKAP